MAGLPSRAAAAARSAAAAMTAQDLAYALVDRVSDELYLRLVGDKVINFQARSRDLTKDDVTQVRTAIHDLGYEEIQSWIATEGASWLSDGTRSVSIEVLKVKR